MTFGDKASDAPSSSPYFRWLWALGKHVIIGGIDATNDASIRFHKRLGFERVAHFREVGRKFGRWLDLVFMQRFLDPPGTIRS
jgi:L-amino acid N-acyltransferase